MFEGKPGAGLLAGGRAGTSEGCASIACRRGEESEQATQILLVLIYKMGLRYAALV
jgi:hypothetical protein